MKLTKKILMLCCFINSVLYSEPNFKLSNLLSTPFEVVIVTQDKKVQPAQTLGGKGTISQLSTPQKIYILPKISKGYWKEFTLEPTSNIAHLTISRLKSGLAEVIPQKNVANNITMNQIKALAKVSPPKKDTLETPKPPSTPAPSTTPPKPAAPTAPSTTTPSETAQDNAQKKAQEITKEEWVRIGLKNNWFSPTAQLPSDKGDELQKKLDQEALDKLINRISTEAKIDAKKLPIIIEAVKAFWEDASRGQKTSIKFIPNYIFKALEQGDDAPSIAGMIGLWMGMPENARDAWRGEKAEKIGKFLEERYRLSRMLVIPTKPETPETIKPKPQQKDNRPLEEQAKEWDENKLNREINKRRFSISGGPFGEKDPQKIKIIEKEIEMLEAILENK